MRTWAMISLSFQRGSVYISAVVDGCVGRSEHVVPSETAVSRGASVTLLPACSCPFRVLRINDDHACAILQLQISSVTVGSPWRLNSLLTR
jgi:hypothetical protein